MRLKLLSLSMMVVLAASSAYAITDTVDEQGIEIRGPGGVKHESVAPPTVHQQRASSTTRVGAKNSTTESASVAKPEKEEKPEDTIASKECTKPNYPPEIIVPQQKVRRFDLKATFGTITVLPGDVVSKLLNRAKPDNSDSLDSYQLLAAIYRANPDSFNKRGSIAGKTIVIPSTDRIALEEIEVGKTVETKINDGTIKNYKLPALVIPWAEEDKLIADYKAKQEERNQLATAMDNAYTDCLKAEAKKDKEKLAEINRKLAEAKTEMQIDDPDLMIPDEEENLTENGKRIVKLKDEAKTEEAPAVIDPFAKPGEKTENSSVQGSTLSFGDGSNTSAEPKEDPKAKEIQELKDRIAALEKQNQQLVDVNEKKLQELAAKVDNLSATQEKQSETVDVVKNEIVEVESSSLSMWIGTIIGFLVLLGGGGFAFLRMKRNKMRKALIDEDDGGDLGLDDINSFPSPLADLPTDVDKDALGATEPVKNSSSSKTELGESAAAENGLMPDLESPDEEIPDLVVEHVSITDNPPDLVPPRHAGASLDLDESGFKDTIQKIKTKEADPVAPKALGEIDIPTPPVSHTMTDSIDLSEESPEPVVAKTDASVMDEWASALSESKEAEKAPEPKADADVMDEWASALSESKEAEKAPEPKADADVMDEWASALSESKEAEKAPEPKADADVMDEWASALSESKEAEKAPEPKADADVMDEWASALSESKEAEKPKTDADVMDEWAAALGEVKKDPKK